MDNAPFDYDRNAMHHIRHIKPCSTYNAWCTKCNEALFPQVEGRFPRSVTEFFRFEEEQQWAQNKAEQQELSQL
jgi:hypothetical protein